MSRFRARRRTHADDLSEDDSNSSAASHSEDDLSGGESDVQSEIDSDQSEDEGEEKVVNDIRDLSVAGEEEAGENRADSAISVPEKNAQLQASSENAEANSATLNGANGESDAAGDEEEIEYEDSEAVNAKEIDEVTEHSKRSIANEPRMPAYERRAKEMEEYRRKLREDPSFIPSVGKFWLHDDRFSGGGRGRGRGTFRGRGSAWHRTPPAGEHGSAIKGSETAASPDLKHGAYNGFMERNIRTLYDPMNDPTEKPWVHDKFEEIAKEQEPVLRHRNSWTSREGDMRSSFRVGRHSVSITKRTSTPELKPKPGDFDMPPSQKESEIDQRPKLPTQPYYSAPRGITGRSTIDGNNGGNTDQVPRPSKRYLASRTQAKPAETQRHSSEIAGAQEKPEKKSSEVLKKAVVAPEFQPSTASPSTAVSSQSPSVPSPSVPVDSTLRAVPPKKRFNKFRRSAYDQPPGSYAQYTSLASPLPTADIAHSDPTITIQPMMTSSGQIVYMTEDGLMVPAEGYASQYMYQPTFQSYMYNPTQLPAVSDGVMTPAYYPAGGEMYYTPTMFSQAVVDGGIAPIYTSGLYVPQPMATHTPTAPLTAIKAPAPVPVRIRKPDERADSGKTVTEPVETLAEA